MKVLAIVISLYFLIILFIVSGDYIYLSPVIIFAIYFFLYFEYKNKKDKNKEYENEKGKDNSASKQEDDFLQLCIKFIIYSARYCGCTKIDTETIIKTEKFINSIDSINYDYRVQELNKITTSSDIDVAFSYVNLLCTEIAKHKKKFTIVEEKLFLDALFSAIYSKQNSVLIMSLLTSLSIVSKGSLSKAKSEYENTYRNNYSRQTDSYEQKRKEKQKQKEKEEEEEAKNNQKIIDLTLELLVEAMKVDRSKMVCELDVIKEYILKNDKEHFQERVADVKKYLSYEYIELNVENACAKINKLLRNDYGKREDILRIVVELIYADETCTNTELHFLNKVADLLKISKTSLDYLKTRYKNKSKKNKKYQDKNYQKDTDSDSSNQSQDNNSQGNSQNSQSDYQSTYASELEKAYAALGITQDATDRELNACWRNLMRVNHPDLMENKGPEAVQKATERCQEINKAFEIVKASRGIK